MKAAIYCRVSTEGQQQEGTSLQMQLESCLTYCQNRSYSVTYRFSEIDSGLTLERPELGNLRELVRNKVIDVIVCHAIDRLCSEIYEGYQYVIIADELVKYGVKLEAATEDINTTKLGELIRELEDINTTKLKLGELISESKSNKIVQASEFQGNKIVQPSESEEAIGQLISNHLERLGYRIEYDHKDYYTIEHGSKSGGYRFFAASMSNSKRSLYVTVSYTVTYITTAIVRISDESVDTLEFRNTLNRMNLNNRLGRWYVNKAPNGMSSIQVDTWFIGYNERSFALLIASFLDGIKWHIHEFDKFLASKG